MTAAKRYPHLHNSFFDIPPAVFRAQDWAAEAGGEEGAVRNARFRALFRQSFIVEISFGNLYEKSGISLLRQARRRGRMRDTVNTHLFFPIAP